MRFTSLLVSILFISLCTRGQELAWKKRVSRVVDLRKFPANDAKQVFYKEIFNAMLAKVKKNELPIYSMFDMNEINKTYWRNISYLEEPDTMVSYDGITGKEMIRVINHSFIPDSEFMYRIYEDWTFDPIICKTNIQIIYIAPLIGKYTDDGILRGRIPLWGITYKDFSHFMKQSVSTEAYQLFYNSIWQSYFENCTGNIRLNYNAEATRIINMQEVDDTVIHTLRNESADTFLSELTIDKIKNNAIQAWDGDTSFLTKPLAVTKLMQLITPKADTYTFLEDGPPEGYKIVYRDFNYAAVHLFKLLENWTFNPATGYIEIIPNGVSLLENIYDDIGNLKETKPMFWIRYSDLQPILRQYEQYHPGNSFALHIWNNYFLSDTKPDVIK